MVELLTLLMLVVAVRVVMSRLAPERLSESLLLLFTLAVSHVVVWGFLLSAVNHLAEIHWWLGVSALTAAIWFVVLRKSPAVKPLPAAASVTVLWQELKSASMYEKSLLIPIGAVLLVTTISHLAAIVLVAPHNWDSMTYHIARVAYFLQNNHAGFFDANSWAQVVQAHNASLLMLYVFLVSGREENLTQIVQFLSYLTAITAVYATVVKLGGSRVQGAFAAGVCGLLTSWLMQSATTQNDLLLTALVGIALYALVSFARQAQRRYLITFALAFALAAGTKVSAIVPLSLLVIVAVVLLRRQLRAQVTLGVATLVAFALLALPSGYYDNMRRFGHPAGPEQVRQMHSFDGESLPYMLQHGAKNTVRYGVDFLTLDGFPPITPLLQLQGAIKQVAVTPLAVAGINLEESEASRIPFVANRRPMAHEDTAYWGILGFALLWPCLLLAAFGAGKLSKESRYLAWGAIGFLLLQGVVGPYDPWRGRYFTAAALFAAPSLVLALASRNRLLRGVVLSVVLVGCTAALYAVLFRVNGSLLPLHIGNTHKESLFTLDRLQQLTANNPDLLPALQQFEEQVPPDATVAVLLREDEYEYPLFGEGLTRRLLPVNSFVRGRQPVPAEAQFLLYGDGFGCTPDNPNFIGHRWCLQRLEGRSTP
jgi:hypothetical protein